MPAIHAAYLQPGVLAHIVWQQHGAIHKSEPPDMPSIKATPVDLTDLPMPAYSANPAIQSAFENLVRAGKLMAQELRAAPRGLVAFISGHSYWISDTYTGDEAMCVPAGEGAYAPHVDDFPMFLSDIEGQGKAELDDITKEIGVWLGDKQFHPVPVEVLDRIALKTASEWRAGLDKTKAVDARQG